jgi:hypothetical protein
MATEPEDLSAEQLAAFEAFTASVREIAKQRLQKYGHTAETSVGHDSMIEAPLTEAELVAAADPALYDVLADATVDGAVGVGLSLGEDIGVYDPAVERIAAEHIAAVKSWLPQMVNEMTSWVQDGLREGYSIEEMVNSLDAPEDVGGSTPRIRAGSPISDARARTIARTEVVGASNGGSYAAYAEAGFESRTWLATLDARTRVEHAALHQVTLPMDVDFIVGGEPAKYPGDARLSAGMRVNCRCTLLVGDDYPVTSDHELALRSEALGLPSAGMSRQEMQLALMSRSCPLPALTASGSNNQVTCPENTEVLSRSALMLHAKDLGIDGRAVMSNDDLASAVARARTPLDDDLSRATKGYAPHDAVREARSRAEAPDRPTTATRLDRDTFRDRYDAFGDERVGRAQSDRYEAQWAKEGAFADPEIHDAWQSYMGSEFRPINEGMRSGEFADERVRAHASRLRRAFDSADNAPLPVGVVYRGTENDELGMMLQSGDKFSDRGFVSTTDDFSVTRQFTGRMGTNTGEENRTLYVIRPSETMKNRGVIAGNASESEWLLPPGSEFEVGDVIEYVTKDGGHHRLIDLRWVGAT